MKTTRPHKETDHENIIKARKLLIELIKLNPSIELTLWASGMMSIVIEMLIVSDYTEKDILDSVKGAIDKAKNTHP